MGRYERVAKHHLLTYRPVAHRPYITGGKAGGAGANTPAYQFAP